jgi:hypothetical protein
MFSQEPSWNARGVGINHWYHVSTALDPSGAKGKTSSDTSKSPEFGNTLSGGKFADQLEMHGWTAGREHQSAI